MSQVTNCFAHVHMTLEEYGLWTFAKRVSYESNKFFFNGSGMAKNEFSGMNKDRFYRVREALIRKGWFRVLEGPSKTKYGRFSCGVYYPLSHDEWVTEHPDQCRNNVRVDPPDSAGEDDHPFAPAGTDNVPAPTDSAYSGTDAVPTATDDGYGATDDAYAGINYDLNADHKSEEKCKSLTTTSTSASPNPGGDDAFDTDVDTHPSLQRAPDGVATKDQSGDEDDPFDHNYIHPPPHSNALSGSGLDGGLFISELKEIFEACHYNFKTRSPHRKAAIALAKKYGPDAVLRAAEWWILEQHCSEDKDIVAYEETDPETGKQRPVLYSWLLKEFVDGGFAHERILKALPYPALNSFAVQWAAKYSVRPAALTPARIDMINWIYRGAFSLTNPSFEEFYEADQLYGLDTAEDERRFVSLLIDLVDRDRRACIEIVDRLQDEKELLTPMGLRMYLAVTLAHTRTPDKGASWDSPQYEQIKRSFDYTWKGHEVLRDRIIVEQAELTPANAGAEVAVGAQ